MSNFNDMFTGISSPEETRQKSIEAFVAESKANRELCYTMADEMALNVSDNPKVFQSYLDVQSRFPNYSVNNALLILKQMPQATQLGDLNYWKNQKNYIRKNELDNNVLILEPGDEYRREDGSVGTYINAKKVYDISQSKNSRHRETPLNDINSLIRAIANSSPVAFKSIAPEQYVSSMVLILMILLLKSALKVKPMNRRISKRN